MKNFSQRCYNSSSSSDDNPSRRKTQKKFRFLINQTSQNFGFYVFSGVYAFLVDRDYIGEQ